MWPTEELGLFLVVSDLCLQQWFLPQKSGMLPKWEYWKYIASFWLFFIITYATRNSLTMSFLWLFKSKYWLGVMKIRTRNLTLSYRGCMLHFICKIYTLMWKFYTWIYWFYNLSNLFPVLSLNFTLENVEFTHWSVYFKQSCVKLTLL